MPARRSVWHLCFEWSTLYRNTGNIYTIPLIVAYGVGAYSITVQFIFIFFSPVYYTGNCTLRYCEYANHRKHGEQQSRKRGEYYVCVLSERLAWRRVNQKKEGIKSVV